MSWENRVIIMKYILNANSIQIVVKIIFCVSLIRAKRRKEIFEFSENNIDNDNLLNQIRLKSD
mgnify:CR=1 FL=1